MDENFYPDMHGDRKKHGRVIRNIERDPGICPSNRELILRFDRFCRANRTSYSRRWHYVQQLGRFARWLVDKDFSEALKEDIIDLVGRVEEATFNGRPLSARTKRDYKMALKRFYKHIEGDDEEYPKKVRWISTALKLNEKDDLWDLVTEDDKKKLLDAAAYPLYKAILAVFFDLGIRPSELLKMRVGDVIFGEDGRLYLRVPGFTKTGPRLLWARDYAKIHISYYLDYVHPFSDDPASPLWMHINARSRDDYLRYRGLTTMLRKIVKRAGISKRIWPYLFRHTRMTEWVGEVKEEHLRKLAGWKAGSQMVSVYSHITNQDAIDALAGEDMEEKIPEHKKKRDCKICRTLNSTLSKFCAQCGHPLVEEIISKSSEEKVMKLVKFISKMAGKNPEIWDEIGRVTVELGDEATPSLAP